MDYADAVTEKLLDLGVRAVKDTSSKKIGYKIRQTQKEDRPPYMLVLGAREAENGMVNVRNRDGKTFDMTVDAFIDMVTTEIETRRDAKLPEDCE